MTKYHTMHDLRPISLLILSLLRLLDSDFPGKLLMDMRIPPLELKILLGSSPPKSRILVRILAVERSSGSNVETVKSMSYTCEAFAEAPLKAYARPRR